MDLQYVQFAKDYSFNEAWKIDPKEEITKVQLLDYCMTGDFTTVSCELFFNTKEGFLVFGFSSFDNDFEMFVNDSINMIKDSSKVDEYLRKKTKHTPDIVRIGILDHWFETGLCELWRRGQRIELSPEFIKGKLTTKPQLRETTLNPLGLSFYYAKSKEYPENWIMYEVSRKKEDKFMIDEKKVLELLEKNLSL